MTYASRALALAVVGFLAYSVPPYLTGGTRVPATFGWHYPLLVVHVLLGSVAMLAAVHQIWPRRRVLHPAAHRRVGRIYVATALPAGLCALVIGAATPFGPVVAVSNVVLATLWLYFTVAGYLSARRRDFAEHRRNMVYGVTLALSIITNRIWSMVLFAAFNPLQDRVFGGDEDSYMYFVAGLGTWLGWTIPLAAVYMWHKRQQARSSAVPGVVGGPQV
ncbi:DUF2306 domain-containing protein [Mycobacterium sp. NAZ190054]|uniref:DUF2306 domain-containing protein n=1 Tax=Mycobacterium sp. NAZ190054 TaxID=1747766 RepID=UPI00079B75D6|nr:DUF2306 domain-containing protein [Mycobacterium sp. NAZ190054]KWX57460.1 hypothetical protein ASJ79_11510 [Mycobacterium sp. NAZ190054]